MGVLADLFIATDNEAREFNLDGTPLNVFPGIDIKGILQVELATLACILTGQDFTDVDRVVKLVGAFEAVYEAEEGPWVYKLPQLLSGALASTAIDGISQIAAAWSNTEEFRRYQTDNIQAILEKRLKEMRHLAQQANAERKGMYLWICL